MLLGKNLTHFLTQVFIFLEGPLWGDPNLSHNIADSMLRGAVVLTGELLSLLIVNQLLLRGFIVLSSATPFSGNAQTPDSLHYSTSLGQNYTQNQIK